MKEANVPPEHKGELGYGDVWTFTSICADTKLVPTWAIGRHDVETARGFILDLASRMGGKIQLTSDGFGPYRNAVEDAFGGEVDYAMLIKKFGDMPGERRYSPAECVGTKKRRITGNPEPKHISTSYAERNHLTMRMGMRPFTRLTNGFSRKIENLCAAVSLHFMHYNFARVHQSLRVTPAMEAGVSDHVWSTGEIAGLIETVPN